MNISQTTEVNDTKAYLAKTNLSKNIVGKLLSSANSGTPGTGFLGLMRLLEGEQVDVTIFSSTNVVGHTTEEQIMEAWSKIPESARKMYWQLDENGDSKILQIVLEKFGSGKLGFQADVEETPKEIAQSINNYENEVLLQGLDTILNNYFTLEDTENSTIVRTFESPADTYIREQNNEEFGENEEFEAIEFSIEHTDKNKNILSAIDIIDNADSMQLTSDMGGDVPTRTQKDIDNVKKARAIIMTFIEEGVFGKKNEKIGNNRNI